MALAGLSAESFSTGAWTTAASAHRRPAARAGRRRGRHDLRRRHVQRAHDELHAPAHRHGRGRHAARASSPAATAAACPGSACCSADWRGRWRSISPSSASSPSTSSSTAPACCSSSSRSSRCAFASPSCRGPSRPATLGFACSARQSAPPPHRLRALRVARRRNSAISAHRSPVSSLAFAAAVGLLGPALYWLTAVIARAPQARRSVATDMN